MLLTRIQRHRRRKRATRNRKIKQYLIDRQKDLVCQIPEDLANELGDIDPGTWLTEREYKRCLLRLAAIRAGLIRKSTRNEKFRGLRANKLS